MMHSQFFLSIFTMFILISSPVVNAEQLVIVVHKNTPVETLSKSEVIDIFMGKFIAFPSGQKAIAVEISDEEQLKAEFYEKLIGRSVASVNAYWARLKFAGRKRHAIVKGNQEEVVDYLINTPMSIGYIYLANINDNLKVVYQVDE